MNSNESFLEALAYCSGVNDSNTKKVHVEPECFAKSYVKQILIEPDLNIKSFYELYIVGCEIVFDLVKT